ncbi:MAG: T9SS type A sorting domain-containing protein [FCB group bacterium]|nr:T9SS type A sorting domain-containing protein [FCB group bacterium]
MKSILWMMLRSFLTITIILSNNIPLHGANAAPLKSKSTALPSLDLMQPSHKFKNPKNLTRDADVFLFISEVTSNYLTISMNNSEPVYGFQFNITTIPEVEFTPTSILPGGSAETAGFTQLVNNDGLILGYSDSGSVIPPGQAVLTSLSWSVSVPPDSVALTNTVFAGEGGISLEVEIGPPVPYYQYQLYNLTIDPTGVFQLVVLLDTITELEPGDEIGIFDSMGITNSGDCSNELGELLVGAGVWDGDQIEISAIGSVDNCSLGGFQLPGYIEGHTVFFRMFRPSTMTEYVLTAEYSAGSGLFGDLFIAISDVELSESIPYGCMDASACNYNPEAVVNWGCIYPQLWYADQDGDGYGSGEGAEYCADDLPPGWVSNNLDPEPDCWNPLPNVPMIDDCGVCAGENQEMDCNGICYGYAVLDDCGECVLGTTGQDFNWAMDCEGICFGTAVLDNSGICCQFQDLDCEGICFGPGVQDNDGACCSEVEIDCSNICFGTAMIDDCGECVGGSTGLVQNWAMDCEGICFGTAVLDDLGTCCQSDDLDCAGICFGPNYQDSCGVCDDDQENDNLSCENCAEQGLNEDCDGFCFGSEYLGWLGDGYCDNGSFGFNLMCQQWDFDGGDCAGTPLTFLDVTVTSENGWFDLDNVFLGGSGGELIPVQLGPAYVVGNGGGTVPIPHENNDSWEAYMAVTDYSDGIVEISVNTSLNIDGFQFTLLSGFTGFTLNGASGGSAGAAGFMVSTNPDGLVLGFSFAGSGIEGEESCVNQGLYTDCLGTCFAENQLTLIGDGQCNEGSDDYPDLNCTKWFFDGGDCAEVILGCADESACNYNPEANIDDASCIYAEEYFDDPDGDDWGSGAGVFYCPWDAPAGWVENGEDNCPEVYNPDQADTDGNGVGDACGDCYFTGIEDPIVSQLIVFDNSITFLEPGDNIGIFDENALLSDGDCSDQYGELLVGTSTWQGEELSITAFGSTDSCAEGGVQLPGFVMGDPLFIRICRPPDNIVYEVGYELSQGSGIFGDPLISISELYELTADDYGCTDETACNFDPEAFFNDGSCLYPQTYWADEDGDGFGDVYLGEFCPGDIPINSHDTDGDNCPDLYNPDQADGDDNGIGDLCQEGCTSETALNYDPYAAIDDGSCIFEDAPLALNAQDNFDGTIALSWSPPGPDTRTDVFLWISAVNDSSIEISMNNTEDIYGFQFTVTTDSGLVATFGQAWGGRAADAGFTLTTNNSGLVLGFSFTGGYIPVGEGVLLNMDWSPTGPGGYVCIEAANFSIYEFWATVEIGNCSWFVPEAPPEILYSVYRNGELIASDIEETNYLDSPPGLYEDYCYYVTAVTGNAESNPSVTACSFSHLGCSTDPEALNYCPDATTDDDLAIYYTPIAPAEGSIINITDVNLLTDSLVFAWSVDTVGLEAPITYELMLSADNSDAPLIYSSGTALGDTLSYYDLVDGLWLYPESEPVIQWQVELTVDNFQISTPPGYFSISGDNLEITDPALPENFSLRPNYPNPFNPVTTISYTLSEMAEVRLDIYDLSGRLVDNLLPAGTMQTAGRYSLQWDAEHFPSGIYLAQLHSGDKILRRKMLLLK